MCGNTSFPVIRVPNYHPMSETSATNNKYYGEFKTHSTKKGLWDFFNDKDIIDN